MSNQLKTINELKQGECIVVAKYLDNEKQFNATYDEKLKVAFFIMPERYNILGYIQKEEKQTMKTLIFEGAGWEKAESGIVSGVGNCRIRTRIRNNVGRLIYLEITGNIHQSKNAPQWAKGFKVVGNVNHCFYADSRIDSDRGHSESLQEIERGHFEFTKENILSLVNDQLDCSFDSMEVINDNSIRVHDTKEALCDSSNGNYESFKDIEININVLNGIEPVQKYEKNNKALYAISYDYIIKHKSLNKWISERLSHEQESFKSYKFYAGLQYDENGLIYRMEVSSFSNFVLMGTGSESFESIINEIINFNSVTS